MNVTAVANDGRVYNSNVTRGTRQLSYRVPLAFDMESILHKHRTVAFRLFESHYPNTHIKKKRGNLTVSSSAPVMHSRQLPCGKPPVMHGLSHGLNKCPPDTYLPALRSGRPFESHYPNTHIKKKRGNLTVSSFFFMGWVMGLEPTTPGTTIRCSAN